MVASSLAAGLILHRFEKNVLKGFAIIFGLAFIFRLISWHFLTRMYEPAFKMRKDSYFTFFDFIKRIRESNFAKFSIFVAGLHFCVNLAAPFFSVFMLRDLRFNYLTYTVLVTTVTVVNILTIGRWGNLADRVGNIKVLKTTSLIIASLPFWWIINQNPVYLVFAQMLSGFAWAGFNLCAGNFILDAVMPHKRVRCIAYFNVLVGLGVFLGSITGGHLTNILPRFFGYKILCLFLVSSSLRFLVVFFLGRKIKEVRVAERISSRDLFYSVIGIKPISSAIKNLDNA